MPSRRAVLSVVAGSALAVAGCASSGEATERALGLTTTGAEGVPGQAVAVEVDARGVGVVTYRIESLPDNWQVTRGDFSPQPTSIREQYPPELVWDPSVGSVDGSFIVSIPDNAESGEYSLPVEARARASNETTVSTAVLTVGGQTPTDTRSTDRQTATRSARTESGR
ncbi:hypothetical protein [Haloarcula sediminis]|uniref:hypothetical protein n=1 Tax=Haloarcula sediminis TaxID=3111777 RepID=UPI002D79A3CD|nr:hypothetical protein [Haloarcula sp. CK38]